jgi:N6-L-threonylcarbamoyladenine synthase
MNLIAIESSCDETSAAVVVDGRQVRSNVVWSQLAAHEKYGGVVPELAARAHVTAIAPVVRTALEDAGCRWSDIDAVAVTNRPGLSGALLVGVNAAKAIAFARDLPLIGVHHIEGHVAANWLQDDRQDFGEIPLPAVCLIVSGGHTDLVLMERPGTYRLLGTTLDDAAGEAFDKGARLLGLGYPGGPVIQSTAIAGDRNAIPLPRAWLDGSYDFSFSGLKTALLRVTDPYRKVVEKPTLNVAEDFTPQIKPIFSPDAPIVDLAASFQWAIVDVLVSKTVRAAEELGLRSVLLAGGVAANALLRSELEARSPVPVIAPRMAYCTDNAAMIGAAGQWAYNRGERSALDLDVYAREPLAER